MYCTRAAFYRKPQPPKFNVTYCCDPTYDSIFFSSICHSDQHIWIHSIDTMSCWSLYTCFYVQIKAGIYWWAAALCRFYQKTLQSKAAAIAWQTADRHLRAGMLCVRCDWVNLHLLLVFTVTHGVTEACVVSSYHILYVSVHDDLIFSRKNKWCRSTSWQISQYFVFHWRSVIRWLTFPRRVFSPSCLFKVSF